VHSQTGVDKFEYVSFSMISCDVTKRVGGLRLHELIVRLILYKLLKKKENRIQKFCTVHRQSDAALRFACSDLSVFSTSSLRVKPMKDLSQVSDFCTVCR
jgi:hypothetical protein